MTPKIIDIGRGPQLDTSRITVYDVLAFARHAWTPAAIAAQFDITVEEVQVALDYIAAHREQVEAR